MEHWRNVTCPDHGPDDEMKAIDRMEGALGDKPANVGHVRALISRLDSVAHYRALENMEFLLRAIGDGTYPGLPAVDVLWRAWEIDDERKAVIRGYVNALRRWSEGVSPDEAIASNAPREQVEAIYSLLGRSDEHKRWLAASLAKTLDVHAPSPEDDLQSASVEEFVRAAYSAALGRHPSADDLRTRVEELRTGRSRNDFVLEIYDSAESRNRQIANVVRHLGGR